MAGSDDSMMDDEILTMFIEDTKEHLGGIEANLMDMERSADDLDPELVNKVFRAAHSIKGGAGFLNLNNIRDLAHKLENVLHMIRNKEIKPDSRIVSKLLGGFDKLLTLVENALESDAEDISDYLLGLTNLTEELLPEEEKGSQDKSVDVSLPSGQKVFTEDALSLMQALKGGHFLYLVEYDLIHDVHAQKKTPLDVIKAMESSGLIVDSKVDVAAVGDLDAPPTNKIPFYVLFSTIVEPDIISYLFAISPERIHRLELDPLELAGGKSAQEEPAPSGAAAADFSETMGTVSLDGKSGLVTVMCAVGANADTALDMRRALLAALGRGRETVLDVTEAGICDLAGVQIVCSACKTFAASGNRLSLAGAGRSILTAQAARAGIAPGTGCDKSPSECLLHAG